MDSNFLCSDILKTLNEPERSEALTQQFRDIYFIGEVTGLWRVSNYNNEIALCLDACISWAAAKQGGLYWSEIYHKYNEK